MKRFGWVMLFLVMLSATSAPPCAQADEWGELVPQMEEARRAGDWASAEAAARRLHQKAVGVFGEDPGNTVQF